MTAAEDLLAEVGAEEARATAGAGGTEARATAGGRGWPPPGRQVVRIRAVVLQPPSEARP